MTILEFLAEEGHKERASIWGFATLAGLANAGALMLVNSVTHAPESATPESFAAFAAASAGAIWATRISAHRANGVIENGLHRLKTRLVRKIENAELEQVERIDTAEILDRITENIAVISIAGSAISSILPSACMLVFGVSYLVWLSPAAFALLLPLQLVGLHLYQSKNELARRLLEERGNLRVRFLDSLLDLLRGAKEIRLSRRRAKSVYADFDASSKTLAHISAKVNKLYDDNALFVATNLYVLLAALVFVLPKHVQMDGPHIAKLVATILFLWGSIQTLLDVYVTYMKSNDALANIAALEKRLESARKLEKLDTTPDPWSGNPGAIRLVDVEYIYPNIGHDTPFHVGPIDLTIEPGEVVFIVGGNGTGKSTLLKILTGLYTPTRGSVQARQVSISPYNVDYFREMISVIFSDFHLFSKAYGLLDADPAAVTALLRDLHIDRKTAFRNGAFTQQKLSTGQKKRLAMVISLLDDRPVMVLDEWAADQDPELRKHFYEEMIPALKRKGKTIIAVSHDDRYLHIADRIVTMEYGQIRSIRTHRTTPPSEVQVQASP